MVDDAERIESRAYDDLIVGETASLEKRVTLEEIARFAAVSGDVNPAHLDAEFAARTPFHDVIAHGMWGGALISAVLGVKLPGPGTIYLSQSLAFRRPVRSGDTIRATVTVLERLGRGRVRLSCVCDNDRGERVIDGEAEVIAPHERLSARRPDTPRLFEHESGRSFPPLIERVLADGPANALAIDPGDTVRRAGIDAVEAGGLITRVGPDATHPAAAASRAFEPGIELVLAQADQTRRLIEALMKAAGEARAFTHVWRLDVPALDRPFIVVGPAGPPAPEPTASAAAARHAIAFANAFGIASPRLAFLSALERDESEPSGASDAPDTGSAAVLGRLSLADALDARADVAVAPSAETASLIVDHLDLLGGAVAAGVILGAPAPIATPTKDPRSLPASCAVAAIVARAGFGRVRPSKGSS